MRGHQGRERGTRHPYHVITMAGAVAAWLEAMGVAEASWEAFVVWLDRMPPDVLREWGRRYSAQQRGTIARMRERRRQYVEATDQDAIDPQTPRALVDVFRRTVLAQFVTGTLRVAPALYEASDFDEQWDVASGDEDAWLEGV